MRNRNQLLFITLIFILTGCSVLINSIKNDKPKIKTLDSHICNFEDEVEFIGESKQLVNIFREKSRSWKLNDKELLYAWLVANSQIRPDTITPFSQFHVFEINNEQNLIVHNGLDKFFGNKINKARIERLVNQVLPNKLKAVSSLYSSLKKHQDLNHKLPEKFFLAKQLIGSNEKYNRQSVIGSKLISRPVQKNDTLELFINNKTLKCFTGNKAEKDNESSLIGIISPHTKLLITSSIKSSSSIFKPNPGQLNLSLCQFKNQYFNNVIVAHGVDNHRSIVENLIKLNLENIQTLEDLKYYIDYPRFVINREPKSITIESLRADQTLEDYLNSLNLPIYHQDNIGKLLTIYSMKLKDRDGMIIDSRPPSIISCSTK